MQEYILLTGMVIKSMPIADYDKRITILTKERGKIGVFAKGARRQGSRFMASTDPFSFGTFKLYESRSSYVLAEVQIQNYFQQLREDFEGAYYGMYFLEMADYYTRENNDEVQVLKLLYQTLRALTHQTFPRKLVQAIYEIKILQVNGEFPGVLHREDLLPDTVYAVNYVAQCPVEKLYSFMLSEQVLEEFAQVATEYRQKYIAKHFNSLEILQNCLLKK